MTNARIVAILLGASLVVSQGRARAQTASGSTPASALLVAQAQVPAPVPTYILVPAPAPPRTRVRWGLLGPGIGIAAAGLAVGLYGLVYWTAFQPICSSSGCYDMFAGLRNAGMVMALVGLGMLGTGIVLIALGAQRVPVTASRDTRFALAPPDVLVGPTSVGLRWIF